MPTVDSSTPAAYQAAIQNSEMVRQATESSLQSAFVRTGTWTAESVTGTESNALGLAITQAAISCYRRNIAIAAQYNVNDRPWRDALRVILGTDYF